eukprot:1160240-Pelagomonas_calceolata.AAC.5
MLAWVKGQQHSDLLAHPSATGNWESSFRRSVPCWSSRLETWASMCFLGRALTSWLLMQGRGRPGVLVVHGQSAWAKR